MKGNNAIISKSSQTSTRFYIYEEVQNIIKDYNLNMKRIGANPILIVFDLFEEMQFRASSTELFTFFRFIQEISEILPRVRPVFVGRAELNAEEENFQFDTLEIGDFDEKSAKVLLNKKGTLNQESIKFIYDNFGGNPLMLTLASTLIEKEGGVENLKADKIQAKKWDYIIRRILGHIHNDRVRKIAVPGMLVRYIDDEVIKEVLAEPTGIGYISDLESKEIYLELSKEVSLISKIKDIKSFSFRQDLRMMCETMIIEQFPEESDKIRQRAIKYYSKYKNINEAVKRDIYEAEYYFHQLKLDQIPQDLNAESYKRLRPYLEHSIIELPAKAQRFLNSLNNQISNLEVRQNANLSIEEWEQSNLGLIKDALLGELDFAEHVYRLLQERSQRVNNGFSEFGKTEALLYQRLNKLKLSEKYIARAIENRDKKFNLILFFEFVLLQIQNFEYEERYTEALKFFNETSVKIKFKMFRIILKKKSNFYSQE